MTVSSVAYRVMEQFRSSVELLIFELIALVIWCLKMSKGAFQLQLIFTRCQEQRSCSVSSSLKGSIFSSKVSVTVMFVLLASIELNLKFA
jgi:hypothetical protein